MDVSLWLFHTRAQCVLNKFFPSIIFPFPCMSSHPFYTVFGGFCYAVFEHRHVADYGPFPLSISLTFPVPSQIILLSLSCLIIIVIIITIIIIIIILGLGSTND
jgi:hypothetical protein